MSAPRNLPHHPGQLGLHLAPHAVVRAARWSVDGLLSLVPSAESGQGGNPSAGLGTHPDDEVARRLRRELKQLWQHTLGDDAFRKALAVSHPELYGRFRRAPCPLTWNKAARQLSATLYRQWARACWRTEPSGLWAGVGLAPLQARGPSLHAGGSVNGQSSGGNGNGVGVGVNGHADNSTVGRVAVAPHLQPFAALLASLAGTAPYLQRGRFKVHPSALWEAPGVWLVRVPTREGADKTRRLRLRHIDPALADQCITALAEQGPLPYTALLRVATRLLKSAQMAQGLVDQLMAAQLLVGGLALPPVFETAWQALDKAAADLLPQHRTAWQATVASLRERCQHLEQHHATLSADAVWQLTLEAARCIEALAPQLGVAPVPLPRACLHWDAGLPAPLSLDAEVLARAHRALAAHERFHRQADPVVALDTLYARSQDEGRQPGLRHLLATQPDWDQLAAALRAQGDDGGLASRLRALRALGPDGEPAAWSPVAGASSASASAALAVSTSASASTFASASAPSPFGALMLRIGRSSALVQGLSHEPWLSYARFGALLGRHAPSAHPLHAWCDAALTQFSQSCNVMLAQVRVACAPLPNLLAQPRFSVARPLDPYGTTPGAWPDAGLQLCHDGQRRWVQSPGSARPLVAMCATALDVGARDPLLERLLLTGWRYRPPVTAASWHDTLPGGGQARRLAPDVLRQRARWRLQGEEALALVQADPARRWALWQDLARRHDWPALLTVSSEGEPAVLMPRDSVLAVEVLFRAPGATAPVFEIEAPEDECLITDPKGRRHATELILVFSRDQHAWNLRGRAVAPVPAQPGATEAVACAAG